jgi:hypothetical protein
MARHSLFSEETVDAICERLADGETLIDLCKLEGMPSESTVYRWLEASEQFREKYARARDQQADHFAEEIVSIADEPPEVVTRGDEESKEVAIDAGFVARQRLRIDARKWFASKVAPKKYGDKIDMNHSGSGLNITINGEK